MNNYEIVDKLKTLVAREREATSEILQLINLALEKRSYVELGFPSMFEWLVKGFGYSNAAAFRRIEAARLIKTVPLASEKLKMGSVNLSTLSKAQSVIRHQEKVSGLKVSVEMKSNIVQQIENKSALETERLLTSIFPEAASTVHQERRFVVNEFETRCQMNLSQKATKDLERLKELLSHKFPNAKDAEIISYALSELVRKLENKFTSVAEVKQIFKEEPADKVKGCSSVGKTAFEKNISIRAVRKLAFSYGGGRCSYKNPVTDQLCGSYYQVQIDHVYPKALGGNDKLENLRLLCRQHNLLAAESVFGVGKVERFRRK